MSSYVVRSLSGSGFDVFEGVKEVRRRLVGVINDFRRGWLRDFVVKVPFVFDYVTIELKKPVVLSFDIEYGYVATNALYVGVGKRHVFKIAVRFLQSRLEGMVFYLREPYDRVYFGIYGLAYLALPEIYEAVKEANIRSDEGHGVGWFRDYLEYLDEASKLDLTALRLEDLGDADNKVAELYVTAEGVAKNLKKAIMHVSRTSTYMFVETADNRNVSITCDFRDKTKKEVMASLDNAPADPQAVIPFLLRVVEDDELFNSVKRSVMNYVEAYKKALIAYTLMNI